MLVLRQKENFFEKENQDKSNTKLEENGTEKPEKKTEAKKFSGK